MTNEEAKVFLDNLKICINEHPIVADWLVEIENRNDEPSDSEKPNNCEYAENPSGDVWECGCFLDTYCEHQIYDWNPDGTINIVECGYEPKDKPQTCEECEHWNDTEEGCADRHGCKTEPTCSKMEQVDKDINVRSKDKPTTQTETQNSNLTFEKADESQTDCQWK